MFAFLGNLDVMAMVAMDKLSIKANEVSTAIRHKAYELPSIEIKKKETKPQAPETKETKPQTSSVNVEDKKEETQPKSETVETDNKVEFTIPTPEPTTEKEPEVVVEILTPEETTLAPDVVVGEGDIIDFSKLVVDEDPEIETIPPEPIPEVQEEEKVTTPPAYTRVESKKRVPTQKDLDAVFSKWQDGEDKNKKGKGKGGA